MDDAFRRPAVRDSAKKAIHTLQLHAQALFPPVPPGCSILVDLGALKTWELSFALLPPLCFDDIWGLALSLASTARADCAAVVAKGLSAGISGSVASEST